MCVCVCVCLNVKILPSQLLAFSFSVLSLPSLPRFYALLEGFFWDTLQVCRYSSFDGPMSSKRVSLMIPLYLRKCLKKEGQGFKVVVPVGQYST